jgi:hypothetical protein
MECCTKKTNSGKIDGIINNLITYQANCQYNESLNQIAMKTRLLKTDETSKPKIRTVYPDVKLSFNEIFMNIRNELMKDYQQIQK